MKLFVAIAFLFLWILSAVPAGAQGAKAKILWMERTNLLWSLDGQSSVVPSKEKSVRFKATGGTFEIPIVALVDEAHGNEWVGKKADLYVETRSGILGISLPYSGVLIWDTGLTRSTRSKENIDELIKRFDATGDLTRLMTTYDPVTDLQSILTPSFFRSADPATDGNIKIKSHRIADGELELELSGPTGAHSAMIWIDLQSRTVVKAVQDGEQIVPRAPRTQP